jgi:hypothetical protein
VMVVRLPALAAGAASSWRGDEPSSIDYLEVVERHNRRRRHG